jgi:hypothetical protein
MQRYRWFEIHDSSWFPAPWRDLVTEALEAVWNANRTYQPIALRLRDALRQSRSHRVVDLCSGSGGPWPSLYPAVSADLPLTVTFTDLHPSARLAAHAAGSSALPFTALAPPIDATRVPPSLPGFRTVFSSFHHFDPGPARAILADAFARREGIAIFEAAQCTFRTLALTIGVPVLAWRAAAAARPRRWDRTLFTCLLPLVPLVLYIDGLLSSLRSYSLADLRELVAGLDAPDYRWHIGEEPGHPIAIRYLIGIPLRDAGPVASVPSR